jgi:hypothetical protein
LKVETRDYSGKVFKSAHVHTNDPQARVIEISIEGTIHPVISVTPTSILLEGQKGQATTGTVLIRGRDKPLRLEQVSFDLQDKINYTVEEVKPGKEYRLHFSNAPDLSGIVTGTLVLRTGYPEKPQVIIRIRGKFRN